MFTRLASVGGCALAAVGILLTFAAGTARADLLYGITRNNQLLLINPTTGAGSLVGLLSSNMIPPGLAFRGTKLYTYDQVTQQLRQLDPATAATLATINLGINIGFVGGDMTFRNDGIGFISAAGGAPGVLYSFDLTVPNATLITGALNPTMYGLAFRPGNALYGLHDGGGPLYTINQATGATTLVGNTGIAGFARGGMACDSSGNLFAGVSAIGAPSFLYRIDATTGAATLVGGIGFTDVSGIAFLPTPPPPPPPPLPPSGSEGSYLGCDGPSGQEGGFGFGGHLMGQVQDTQGHTRHRGPVLQGPFLPTFAGNDPVAGWLDGASSPPVGAALVVFNVSQRQGSQPGSGPMTTEVANGWASWVLGSGLALGVIACFRSWTRERRS